MGDTGKYGGGFEKLSLVSRSRLALFAIQH